MNIFVLNTGRCGSTTFIKACKHISNYSSEHESRSAMVGEERRDYPENHIEADNRLSWLLGRLDKKYGDTALYIHLKRNEVATAQSFTKRYSFGIIKAYRGTGIMMGLSDDIDPMIVSMDYCETVNSNIDHFLKDKSKKLTINLESIEQGFLDFWTMINAEGDIDLALTELNKKHNASRPQESKPVILFKRLFGKVIKRVR